jgi:hypothetical protein
MRFSDLVNGVPSGFFSSSCGLRHGDPLSPLLFVVVMEESSKMMSTTVDRGLISCFSVGSRNNEDCRVSSLVCECHIDIL